MTHELAESLAKTLGLASIPALTSVAGGDTATAWRARLDGRDCFIKTEPRARHDGFAAEADGLEHLRAAPVVVPKVIALGTSDTAHWLALEWLELQPLENATSAELGRRLAAMHELSGACYGWHRNNRLGRSTQINEQSSSWPDFFANQRLGFMRAQLPAAYDGQFKAELDDVIAAVPEWLSGHEPTPSLLHGDLWMGNAAACHQDGSPSAALYDPACYYGDREADLAMTRLFGGFSPSFYQAYEDTWPLPDGHRLRATLYNLYHVLNHAILFGGGYRAQASAMMHDLRDGFR